MPSSLQQSRFYRQQGYINGQWVDADNQKTFPVMNPATGASVAEVADMGAAETARAIDAAEAAQVGWAALPARTRCSRLERWYQAILDNKEELGHLMTLEQGKPLAEAIGEVAYGAAYIKWFAEEGKRVYGDIIPAPMTDRRNLVTKQPVGIVGAITPWNFPSAMLARKLAPALAAGCVVVAKPAAETPLSALALAVLAEEAGIPAGVINLVTGMDAPAIGSELTSNSKVRKITFTGSTRVGKILMAQSAETMKRTSMELGGNAPMIIFDDADLDIAIPGALAAKYRNSGQTCICSNRLFVQDGIYDEFVERLKAEVEKFSLGNGMDDGVTHGPLITEQAVMGVESKVHDAVIQGARIVTGGERSDQGACFFQPTIIADAKPSMRVFSEEIFGPVAPVFRFSDEAEVIELANKTEYGLAAYFYTENMNRMWRVSEALDYGMVGVNETAISSEVIPFGGMKESGQGREGSRYGLDDYLETKYICMGGLSR